MRTTAPRLGFGALLLARGAEAFAQAKKIDLIMSGLHGTANAVFYLILTVFTLIGVWMVYVALAGFYKASDSRRQNPIPQRAYWVALLVGGALTSVSLWAVIAANTVAG